MFFVGAAMITPPDVVTQIMMAMPLILLYEIGILGAKIFGKTSKSDSEEENDDEQEEEISEFDDVPETDDIDSELEN